MATIKSFTDIEQSKKLAKILPLESTDMYWRSLNLNGHISWSSHIKMLEPPIYDLEHYIPCWSLAALFNLLPNGTNLVKEEADTKNERYMCTVGIKDDIIPTFGKNPVDACMDMIEKLHELNLL